MSHIKGIMGRQEELQGGAPLAGHPHEGPPKRGSLVAKSSLLEALGKALKGGFPKSNHKVLFTIHENIFSRPLNLKIFL
jgi:hypothetical protein